MDDSLSSIREEAIGDGEVPDNFEENKSTSPNPDDSNSSSLIYLSKVGSRKDDTQVLCRFDQPIQNIPIKLHMAIPKKNNDDNTFCEDDLKLTWYRYSIRSMCSSERCIYGEDFGNTLVPLSCQCVTCLKNGNIEHSCFCCVKCMIQNWKDHQNRYHTNMINQDMNTDLSLQNKKSDYISQLTKYLKVQKADGYWEPINEGEFYTPTEKDIGHVLKIILTVPFKQINLHSEYTSTPVVAYPPYSIRRTLLSSPQRLLPQFPMTLCSYNLLAESYATAQQFSYCPKWALLWDYRKTRLFKDIESIRSDIYCLQEVQQDSYTEFWLPKMKEMGYEGNFAIKTRASHTPNKLDGCAIFFNTKKFHCVHEYHYKFNDTVNTSAYFTEKQKNRMLKNNIAQILVLELNSKIPSHICVCNCHIFWNPEYRDVKLWQVYQLLHYLDMVYIQQNIPIFLCGDFNSEPTSAVYEFISKGKVEPSNPDLAYDPCRIVSSIIDLKHDINYLSAYKSFFGQEPEYTNYTANFQGCLDYIWYSHNTTLLGVSPMPSEECLRLHRDLYIPNPQYPSDHLPIIAKFDLRPM